MAVRTSRNEASVVLWVRRAQRDKLIDDVLNIFWGTRTTALTTAPLNQAYHPWPSVYSQHRAPFPPVPTLHLEACPRRSP